MVSRETYLQQAARRSGTANPERIDFAHWAEMVRSGEGAYLAAVRHLGDAAEVFPPEVRWCFERFGMTRTRLADGRIVCVAGEHEDHYDPDFCIYNDVVVVGPGGDDVAIYGYPEAAFPPTDFHTATLVGDRILLVGSLGYGGRRRYGRTQVLALDVRTFEVQSLETAGEGPGWLSRHEAELTPGGDAIRVGGGKVIAAAAEGAESYDDNGRVFRLDLRAMTWSEEAGGGAWVGPAVPEVEWPGRWARVGSLGEARHLGDAVSRSVAPDHPLFPDDYAVVAANAESDEVLMRSRADAEEFVVSEGPTWAEREVLRFERFRGVESWLVAAGAKGERWWPWPE